MNKTLKTVALFSVLSLMAVGCQKETMPRHKVKKC